MGNDEFWEKLVEGSNSLFSSSIDSHFKKSSENFESVRNLTDVMRSHNALRLPVEAGSKVVFAGGMGAYLTYDDCPSEGDQGEVVLVKSANGGITHHEGKVFVKWDDGKFRSIHAEHLRLASEVKKASDLKAQFEKIKDLAEKKPDNKFLKGLLKQMADEGFSPTDKQMKVVKEIEEEAKQQAEMKKELKSLKSARAIRVSSIGDLTQFLKRADGKLIHKSTNDLWSYSKGADGQFLVERLFDEEGEPLKG